MGKEQLVIMIYLSRYYTPIFACYKIEAISIKKIIKMPKYGKSESSEN